MKHIYTTKTDVNHACSYLKWSYGTCVSLAKQA